MNVISIRSHQGDYAVTFGGSIEQLAGELGRFSNAVLVIDARVADLYSRQLGSVLSRIPHVRLEATEENKTLNGAARALRCLQEANGTRKTTLVAIGGGIIQDIATFASHVYYRGLSWHYVPTTLLSMADSCIGAKGSLNFNQFKNQLGVFHSPAHVSLVTEFLNTLSDDDIRSGYGEIAKLLLTGNVSQFTSMMKSVADQGFRNPRLEDYIRDSLLVKKGVIEEDEYETDLRRILNYGHTFGHALEAVTTYAIPHGLAVVWGMDLVNWIASQRGLLKEGDFSDLHTFFQERFGWHIAARVSAAELISAAKRDKKVTQDKVALVLLERPGKLAITSTSFDSELERDICTYLESLSIVTFH